MTETQIKEGDRFRLVDLDRIFVITPMVPELAQMIERLREASGVRVEELLQALREERERYHQETYEPPR